MSELNDWEPSANELGKVLVPRQFAEQYDLLSALVIKTGLRAQLAVLEEEDAHMVGYLGSYTDENREWRQAKIAALRKELEG